MDRRTIVLSAVMAAVGVLVTGCATGQPQSRLASKVTTDSGKIQTLRYKVFGYTALFAATVEDSADTITRTTTDVTVKKNALLWKMNAVPASLTATVHPDPLANLLDLWALSAQMEQYFNEGPGRELFGSQQGVAVAASRELTAAAIAMFRDFVPQDIFDKATPIVGAWVTAHPLRTPLFARDSAVELVGPLMVNHGGSLFAALDSLEDRVDSLTARASVYAAVIPKLVRWQAELLVLGVPDTLVGVQEEVIQSLREHHKAITDAIDQQRLQAFSQLQAERIAVMKDLEAAGGRTIRDATSVIEPQVERERIAVLSAIDEMRIQSVKDLREALASFDQRWLDSLQFVRGEREAATRDAEQIATRTVDHAFRQLYLLLAILYLATLAGGAILIVLWKKSAWRSRSV